MSAEYVDTKDYLYEYAWLKMNKSKKKRILRVDVPKELIHKGQYSGYIDWNKIGTIDMTTVRDSARYEHPLAMALEGIFPKPAVYYNYLSTGYKQEFLEYTPYSKYLLSKWDSTMCENRAVTFDKLVIEMYMWEEWIEKYDLNASHLSLRKKKLLFFI